MARHFDDFDTKVTCEEGTAAAFDAALNLQYDESDSLMALQETFARNAKFSANLGDLDAQDESDGYDMGRHCYDDNSEFFGGEE